VNPLEKMRRGDVGEIERRILSQQDDVVLRQRLAARFAQRAVLADLITTRVSTHHSPRSESLSGGMSWLWLSL
jgi:hypothetical protein